MNKKVNILFLTCLTCFCINSMVQKAVRPSLDNIKNFKVVNREIAFSKQDGKDVVNLNGKEGDGIAWI